MRADREQPLGHCPVTVLQGAFDQRLLRQLRLQFAPQRDAFEQRAALVHPRQAIRQRRVHVEVRVDERRAEQEAVAVDDLRAVGGGQLGADRTDAPILGEHVLRTAPVGETDVAKQKCGHGMTSEVIDAAP